LLEEIVNRCFGIDVTTENLVEVQILELVNWFKKNVNLT